MLGHRLRGSMLIARIASGRTQVTHVLNCSESGSLDLTTERFELCASRGTVPER